MAKALKVIGLMNVQFAIQGEGDAATVYVLEVNPRASRTVPFVVQGHRPAAGEDRRALHGRTEPARPARAAMAASHARWYRATSASRKRCSRSTSSLAWTRSSARRCAPPARSWASGATFGEAMLKSQIGAGSRLPDKGTAVHHREERRQGARGRRWPADLVGLGFQVVATKGTAAAIADAGLPVRTVNKVKDGRPHIVDMVKAGEIQLVFSTVDETRTAIADSRHIRTAALAHRVTYYTTMAGCEAATEAMNHQRRVERHVAAGTARESELKSHLTHRRPSRPFARASEAVAAVSLFASEADHEHHSPDTTRQRKAQGRAATPEERRTPRGHPGHRRGARAG